MILGEFAARVSEHLETNVTQADDVIQFSDGTTTYQLTTLDPITNPTSGVVRFNLVEVV